MGYKVYEASARGSELPPETTPFANALGFAKRSSLENNAAGSATSSRALHRFLRSALEGLRHFDRFAGVRRFWHHWPDERMHKLAEAGAGLHRLAKETHAGLESDDFWTLVERLSTGRRLVITGDHGYAATGLFPDLIDKDQVSYLKSLFKSGRSSNTPSGRRLLDSYLFTCDCRPLGNHAYVLGRRKWKSAAGYPTLQHGGAVAAWRSWSLSSHLRSRSHPDAHRQHYYFCCLSTMRF